MNVSIVTLLQKFRRNSSYMVYIFFCFEIDYSYFCRVRSLQKNEARLHIRSSSTRNGRLQKMLGDGRLHGKPKSNGNLRHPRLSHNQTVQKWKIHYRLQGKTNCGWHYAIRAKLLQQERWVISLNFVVSFTQTAG